MKLFRYISIIIIITLVIFCNLNEDTPAWDLAFNMQYYLIVSAFIYLGWVISKDVLTRSLLIAVGFYYSFELIMDIFHIVNPVKYDQIYNTTTINYIWGIGIGFSLLSFPIYNSIKRWTFTKIMPFINKFKWKKR